MFKAIFVTDQHFRSKVPINRNDDILESLLKKMEWVYDFASKNGIKKIIHGGDFFNSPSPSDYVINKIFELVAKYSHIKNYYIIGNHDLIGGNTNSAEHCKIGILKYFPNFFHLGCVEFKNCFLCGYDYSKINECPESIDPHEDFSIKTKKHVIVVVHSMICDDRQIFVNKKIKTINWGSILTTASVVLSGHYHPGIGVRENSLGSFFVNPGAMIRQEASKIELKREPKIAVIKVGKTVSVKTVKIPHKRNVFNLERLEGKINTDYERMKFMEALEDLKDEDLMAGNILEILDNLNPNNSKLKGVLSKKVVRMCKNKIKELTNG